MNADNDNSNIRSYIIDQYLTKKTEWLWYLRRYIYMILEEKKAKKIIEFSIYCARGEIRRKRDEIYLRRMREIREDNRLYRK